MDNCTEFWYTIQGANESCTGSWEEKFEVPLLLIRVISIVIGTIYSVLYFRILLFHESQLGRSHDNNKFKRVAVRCLVAGNLLMVVLYATGNLFQYSIDTVLGKIAVSCALLSPVFFFGAVGSLLLMVMQVYLTSCGGKLKACVVYDLGPMIRFIAPFAIIDVIVLILLLVGVIYGGLDAIRISVTGSVPSLVVYVWEARRYLNPVIVEMKASVSSQYSETNKVTTIKGSVESKLRSRILFLEQQKRFIYISVCASIVVFSLVGIKDYFHEPSGYFFIVFQTMNTAQLYAVGILGYRLLRDVKRSSPATSPDETGNKTDESGNCSTNAKLFESSTT